MKVLIQYVANGMAWKWANEIQDQSSGSKSQNETADPVCGQSYGLAKNQSNYSTVVYRANFGGIASECSRSLTPQDQLQDVSTLKEKLQYSLLAEKRLYKKEKKKKKKRKLDFKGKGPKAPCLKI